MDHSQVADGWKKAEQLIKLFGMPYKVVPEAQDVCWTGKVCHIINPTANYRSLSNAIHEFAHWLVAAKSRRKKAEFGLGSCPDSNGYLDQEIGDEKVIEEEMLASALGIAIERTLGLDWKATFREHDWEPGPGYNKILRMLREKGLLTSKNHFRKAAQNG